MSATEFYAESNKLLAGMLDGVSSSQDQAMMFRELDAYRHLNKLQAMAMAEGTNELRERFFNEFYSRNTALHPTSEGVQPSEEQVSEFRGHVRTWFQLDTELKDLQRQMRDKRAVKNKLREVILDFMRRYNIEELRTQDGRLRFETRSVKRAPTKAQIQDSLMSLFESQPEVADQLSQRLFNADNVTRVSLKRIK